MALGVKWGGLTASGDGVGQRGVQPLRRAVDRRGQPGRPRTDDHQVADLPLLPDLAQPEGSGQLGGRRVAQQSVPVEDDGCLVGAHPEPARRVGGVEGPGDAFPVAFTGGADQGLGVVHQEMICTIWEGSALS